MHYWIWIIVIIAAFKMAESSGVFELRLKSFSNDLGQDSSGQCCSGEPASSEPCGEPCRTMFRVCLKLYQAKIDTTSPCTFGDVITPVLGQNSFQLGQSNLEGFVNPIRFPFDFGWPGTFSLIVEAWHHNNASSSTSFKATRGGGGAKTLIARLTTQRWLDVGAGWTEGEHGAAHSRLRYEYRVTCDAHYYGAGCGSLCRPRDDSFGHYTCSPMGQIVCVPGWQGDYCTKPRCLPGCDDQHGHCNQPNECLCHSGWKGPLCDQCERYPGCLHGSCHKPWDCLCDEGWGGLFCNQDLNYCTNHRPCRHGGTCFNTGQGSYTCSCPPGRTGTDCEKLVDCCAQRPCLNGATCRDNGTSYMCECPKHWYGAQCEISAKTCGDLPCQNGATCTEGVQGYKCQCLGGYSGVDCETQTDDCSPNPCRNGATCTDLINGYQCNCPDGFVGADCEVNVNDCIGNPCLNGGSCIDLVNQFRCQCVPGYVGQLCQSKVDYCLAKPCANGGLCSDLVNDYRCACRPGFSSKDCSVDINECAKEPCLNGGRCVDRVNGFRCVCTGSWMGQLCGEEEGGSVGNISRHISEREDSALSSEHIVVIATLSTAVPLLVLVAAVVVVCMKQRRARERRKADDEARMQNEQNAVHSSVTKRGDAHMIKNTWGPCVKDIVVGGSEVCFAAKQVATSPVLVIPPDLTPVYTLHRSRSHKQLNTDASVHRQSNRASCKDLDNLARTDKRISILSVDSSLCNTSDQSLLKRSHDKDGTLPSSSVYVIDDHFTRHNDTLLATEV